jgi:hypothetical protein
MNRHDRDAIRAAREAGLTDVKIIAPQNGKHNRLVGTYQGKPFSMIVPRGANRHAAQSHTMVYVRRELRRLELQVPRSA